MTCARCEALQRANADLVERLAAWEAYEADCAREAATTERVCRWRSAFGLTLAQARTLMALCDRAGRLVSHDALVEMARGHGAAEDVADSRAWAGVMVCNTRRILKGRLGQGCRPIETVWGLGFKVEPVWADCLRKAAGDAA